MSSFTTKAHLEASKTNHPSQQGGVTHLGCDHFLEADNSTGPHQYDSHARCHCHTQQKPPIDLFHNTPEIRIIARSDLYNEATFITARREMINSEGRPGKPLHCLRRSFYTFPTNAYKQYHTQRKRKKQNTINKNNYR